MTKDSEEFSQFTESVACREYTLLRDENHLTRKVGFEETPKLGPYWKSQPSTYKVNVEWNLEMNLYTDNSHSWVRIAHGLNKLVTDLSNNKEDGNNEQETSEMKFEEFALKTNVLAFASRSKAKARLRRRTSACSSTRTVPIGERTWTDIEPEDYSPIANPVSKQLSTLLRHGHLPREDDGAIKFWRLKEYLQDMMCILDIGLMKSGKAAWREAEETRTYFNIVLIHQEILYLGANQGHSGCNLIDPSLQDNVLIPNDLLEYIYHIGCAIILHSIMNSGLIPGGQNLSKRQTVFFTYVDPMNEQHEDPDTIDLEAPRLAQYLHNAWKRHQDAVYWIDIRVWTPLTTSSSPHEDNYCRNTENELKSYHNKTD